jgi:RND family efflux transporter MFP subunit
MSQSLPERSGETDGVVSHEEAATRELLKGARPTHTAWVALLLMALVVLFGAAFVLGYLPKVRQERAIGAEAAERSAALPQVTPVKVRLAEAVTEVPLPGTTEAIQEAGIYARTDGYVKQRYVDIGDRVKGGQLLAEIETPETDQSLKQAVANVFQAQAQVNKAQADLNLAKTTYERFMAAGLGGGVSKQEQDEKAAAVTTAQKTLESQQATVVAMEANVNRLRELQQFQKVVAPFEGIVSARNVDVGSLISAGSGNSGIKEMFHLVDSSVIRLRVAVPQTYSVSIKAGQMAAVTVREYPKRVFDAKVVRTAGALDAASRTLQVEVNVPNANGDLLAGMYATVRFKVPRGSPPVVIPANALMIDAAGPKVAVIDAGDRIHYRAVTLGRDYGPEIEVTGGVEAGEIVATGISPGLADASVVDRLKPVTTSPASGPATAPSR